MNLVLWYRLVCTRQYLLRQGDYEAARHVLKLLINKRHKFYSGDAAWRAQTLLEKVRGLNWSHDSRRGNWSECQIPTLS
ncbi:hypothetical protein FACS1894202_03710 [Clostridia bacterium]|nr:hypothetical protein FACS1894202_03710 [Clostridia bacterium]